MRIVIVGAGKSGAFLAEKLRRRHDVTLIEQRSDRVETMRTRVPEVGVVLGDGCEPSVLDAAGVAHADMVCALTGDDEDNLVVSLLSQRAGAKKVVARVNHPNNHWLFETDWGVDIAVCASDIIYDLVDKEIGLADVVTVMMLKASDVAVEELVLPEGARAVEQTVASLGIPESMHVMAIVSKREGVRIPRGDTVMHAGDQILLLCSEGVCREETWELFVGGDGAGHKVG